MKSIYLFLLLNLFPILGFSQVNSGIKTNSPTASSALEINSKLASETAYRGLLLPRINLSSLSDQSNVSSPTDGMVVYNTNPALDLALGIWDQTNLTWGLTKLYLKTPKVATIIYQNSTGIDVLTSAGAGGLSPINLSTNRFMIESDGGINDLSISTTTAFDRVVLPSGKYLIQFSITLKANSPATVGGNVPYVIKNQNSLNYYNMGYFVDVFPYSYTGTTFASTTPNQFRTESAILSPSDNSEHNLVFLFSLDSTLLNVTTPYMAFILQLGRMTGSSYFGKATIETSKTKVKIIKLL